MTSLDSVNYSKALAFAATKHAGQVRRDGSPYILHPIKVSMSLRENGYDIRYQIVGLFHDLLEDTDTTENELEEFCDPEMIEAVKLVTKFQGYKESEYIENILKNPIAKAVKNSDRIDNLRDLMGQKDTKFIHRYVVNTKESFYGKFSEQLDNLLNDILMRIE